MKILHYIDNNKSLEKEKSEEPENINKNRNINSKKSNKFLIKKSEKALKIVEDLKKNIGDIYKVNYNS